MTTRFGFTKVKSMKMRGCYLHVCEWILVKPLEYEPKP